MCTWRHSCKSQLFIPCYSAFPCRLIVCLKHFAESTAYAQSSRYSCRDHSLWGESCLIFLVCLFVFIAGTAVCFNHAIMFAHLKSTDAACRSASKHTWNELLWRWVSLSGCCTPDFLACTWSVTSLWCWAPRSDSLIRSVTETTLQVGGGRAGGSTWKMQYNVSARIRFICSPYFLAAL